MEPRVTSRETRSANIFTPQKRFSAVGRWDWWAEAEDARTSDPAGNILRLAWSVEPSLAGSGKLLAVAPAPLPGRWGSPAGPEQSRAVPGESQPTFRPRSRSEPSQIPETPCPYHHGCEQKRGWPAATSPTSAARLPLSRRSCRPLLCTQPLRREHLRGQIPAKFGREPGRNTEPRPSRTEKPVKQRQFPALLFAFCSVLINPAVSSSSAQKCKLLLHLGNSRAFYVDNKLCLTYDFPTGVCAG